MDISLSEQIRLAALEHHLSDQYPDLAAEMKVFAYCTDSGASVHRQSFAVRSWARHMALWMAGIAATAMLALLLLPAFSGPTRCPQSVATAAPGHPAQSPVGCTRPHAGS